MTDPEEGPEDPEAAAPGGGRKKRWRRRKEARPEELIAAALQLFAERGFRSTSLKDVGQAAGVSKATVYLYFKSKEDLLLAAVSRSVVPILDFADDYEIDADEPADVMIRTLCHRWIEAFEEASAAGLPKLVVAEAAGLPELGRLYVGAVLQRARRLFQRILKRGIRDGRFREMDVRQVAHVLLAPLLHGQIHVAALPESVDPGFPGPHALIDAHLDLVFAGLQAGSGEGRSRAD